MATSSFKSTTKRSSIGGDDAAASSNNNAKFRRSRSLSRAPSPPRRGRFVNTVRGSGFPEINLDLDLDLDLDQENLFRVQTKGERSRSAAPRRRSDITNVTNPASSSGSSWSDASQRRGRSVSRPHSSRRGSVVVNDGDERISRAKNNNNVKKISTSFSSSSSNSGVRRRSVSVARYHFSDSEGEEHSHKSNHLANDKSFDSWNYRKPSVHKPVTSNHQRLLKRSTSQSDLSSKFCDGYSSHSSVLTDEEPRDTSSKKNGTERTMRAYSQKKTEHPNGNGVETGAALYEVMRQELRHAVEDIRTEIKQGVMNVNPSAAVDDSLQSNNSDVFQAVSVIRKDYTAKLEQSEKRKQDLLAEIMAEENRGRELSKIVKELLPDAKDTAVPERPILGRKKNERSWMSKCLTEDAEKYFDDFLSNVEDTDMSSFDGERSDASSTLGVRKAQHESSSSLPVEMDGVALPWLQWETVSDEKSKEEEVPSLVGEDNSCHSAAQGESIRVATRSCSQSTFSLGKYVGHSLVREAQAPVIKPRYDMGEYLETERHEEIIFEMWRQRDRITCGSLILCCATQSLW